MQLELLDDVRLVDFAQAITGYADMADAIARLNSIPPNMWDANVRGGIGGTHWFGNSMMIEVPDTWLAGNLQATLIPQQVQVTVRQPTQPGQPMQPGQPTQTRQVNIDDTLIKIAPLAAGLLLVEALLFKKP